MVERLLRLKASLDFLAAAGTITNNLTAAQWHLLKQIEVTLAPFMLAQQILEGEKYVTLSLVPKIIVCIRNGLTKALENEEDEVANSDYMQRMLSTLRDSFNTEWGRGSRHYVRRALATPSPTATSWLPRPSHARCFP
jgi:hypothetical protein